MFEKIGFIGCGNMGTAMLKGILASGKRKAEDIMISCRTKETLEEKKAAYGVNITTDNREVAEFADLLFLAVKPQFYEGVIAQIQDAVTVQKPAWMRQRDLAMWFSWAIRQVMSIFLRMDIGRFCARNCS